MLDFYVHLNNWAFSIFLLISNLILVMKVF